MNYFVFFSRCYYSRYYYNLINTSFCALEQVFLQNDCQSSSGFIISTNKMGEESIRNWGAVILLSILINWLLLWFHSASLL
jgi:hypothetical protein